MAKVSVRYIVNDVDEAIPFYSELLGFNVEMHPAPGFAALGHGSLRLLLNAPGAGGAGQDLPSGDHPAPGGWNRIQIPVKDLQATYASLRERGARFRSQPIEGTGVPGVVVG